MFLATQLKHKHNFWTGIKFGVPGGALYYTINAGVWGNPFESKEAVDRGIQYLPPEVQEYRKSIREISRPDFLPPSDYNYGEKMESSGSYFLSKAL